MTGDQSLPQAFAAAVMRYGEQPAVDFAGRVTTFSELHRLSDRAAAALAGAGVGKGDRVGLYGINSDGFVIAYLAIIKAGATVVPINVLLNTREIDYILSDSGARGLIYHEGFADRVQALDARSGALEWFTCMGNEPAGEDDFLWSRWLETEGEPDSVAFDAAEDVASILYTSGTTGAPKGAMLTHGNLLANTASVVQASILKPGQDRVLVVLPMFHAFAATVGMLAPLLYGSCILPVPKFDPGAVLDSIAAGGATVFLGVPSMYTVLLNVSDAQVQKFASVGLCVSGGAAMPREVMRRFEERYGVAIYEGDGPTECSPVTCVNPVGGRRKPGSVGLPIPGVEMRILTSDGTEVDAGEPGEICVRGANVMKGYWNRSQETADAFHGDWFRTGDLGYRDEDGYFYIVDRIKDMIIVNGMNVYPRVIEEALYQHPGIHEAAVVGEPHDLHGEIVVAYLVAAEDGHLSSTEVRNFCKERLGRHEVPRKVTFLDSLPKNAAGKILKRELRKAGELERGVDSRGSS